MLNGYISHLVGRIAFWLIQVFELIHGENCDSTSTLFPSVSPFGSYVLTNMKAKEMTPLGETLKFPASGKLISRNEFFITKIFLTNFFTPA